MSKIEFLFERFRGRIPYSLMKECVNADHTPTKKYVEYMFNVFSIYPNTPHEQVFMSTRKFEELLPYIQNKDISDRCYLKGDTMIKTIEEAERMKSRRQSNKVNQRDVTIIKETETYILLQPHTHEASMKYGMNTTWCTTERDYPQTFYKYYTGYLCYLISKIQRKHTYNKIALHVPQTPVYGKYMFSYDVYDQIDIKQVQFISWESHELKEIDQAYRDFVNETEMPIPPMGSLLDPYRINPIQTIPPPQDGDDLSGFRDLMSVSEYIDIHFEGGKRLPNHVNYEGRI